MGRMLKLMGNVPPARQEAFLTLMERGLRRGPVGGAKVHWFPNSCRASVAFIATLKLLSPLLSPLLLPLHCPPVSVSSFRLSFVCPPGKRSHLLAFNTSSRPLYVVLSSSPNPLLLISSQLFSISQLLS